MMNIYIYRYPGCIRLEHMVLARKLQSSNSARCPCQGRFNFSEQSGRDLNGHHNGPAEERHDFAVL